MTDAELLKQARARIMRGYSGYICYAINQVGCRNNERSRSDRLRSWVMKMLKGHLTYGAWVESKTGIAFSRYQCKQGRLAWLDWMIAYCEERGQ